MEEKKRSVLSSAIIREVLPATFGNKYGDLQPDTMQKVRDLETLSLKQDVFIKFFPSGLKEHNGRV